MCRQNEQIATCQLGEESSPKAKSGDAWTSYFMASMLQEPDIFA